jgi:hypothetical protein
MKHLYHLLLITAALVAATGCESISRNIGGRDFPVMVDSQPPGATLYVIPNDVWDHHGTKLLTDPTLRETLDFYRVNSTDWPAKVFVQAKPYTCVAVRGNKYTTQPYTPKTPKESVTIRAPQQ